MLTNEQVKIFTNKKARVMAAKLLADYRNAVKAKTEWTARTMELGNVVSADTAQIIDDGATQDGRPIATCNNLLGNIQTFFDYVAWCEANDSQRVNQWLALVAEDLTESDPPL